MDKKRKRAGTLFSAAEKKQTLLSFSKKAPTITPAPPVNAFNAVQEDALNEVQIVEFNAVHTDAVNEVKIVSSDVVHVDAVQMDAVQVDAVKFENVIDQNALDVLQPDRPLYDSKLLDTSSRVLVNRQRFENWTSTFQPVSLDEVVGHSRQKAVLAEWVGDDSRGPLLLHGPVGVGKTLLAQVVLARLKQSVVVCNTVEDFEEALMSKNPVLFDEIDNCDAVMRGRIVAILKKWKAGSSRVIFTADGATLDRSLKTLQSECSGGCVRLFPLEQRDLQALSTRLLKRSNGVLPSARVSAVIRECNGDARKLMVQMELDVRCFDRGMFKLAGGIGDSFLSPWDLASLALQGQLDDPDAGDRLYHSDTFLAPGLLRENYVRATRSLDAVAEAASLLSDALVLNENYETLHYSAFLMHRAAALHCTGCSRLQFPTAAVLPARVRSNASKLKDISTRMEFSGCACDIPTALEIALHGLPGRGKLRAEQLSRHNLTSDDAKLFNSRFVTRD